MGNNSHLLFLFLTMICAHNTFTFRKRNLIAELFSCFWRCQSKSISELYYDYDVRCFDIRVTLDNGRWKVTHGLVDLDIEFWTLDEISDYFKVHYPHAYVRVINENCDFLSISKITYESSRHHDNIFSICIKNPWKVLYEKFEIVDCCCHLFNWDLGLSFWQNLKQFDITSWSVKRWAKKHNPEITEDMINDENKVYLIDFI